jgi:conjugative relaxase-like TrwC/TraI family protein
MLSVALVRSAGGAANYFAADNYYTRADADRSGQWLGKAAEKLGLSGTIDPKTFEALLRGDLPDGSSVGRPGQVHRAGIDLTFSLPKSWSLLALVGGDRRILDAYKAAVIETLQWAERNAAQARVERGGTERLVQTGNLAIALYQHDTNRNQEPNAHFHAVVANVTQLPDGSWRALRNDKLWSLNTLLNSMTMARFRERVTELGYEPGPTLKHGNFEALGISREAVMAFSTRRQEVLAAAAKLDHRGLRAGVTAALMSRAPKAAIADREALTGLWQDAARAHGIDLTPVMERANARASHNLGRVASMGAKLGQTREQLREWFTGMAERLNLAPTDPLLPPRPERSAREDSDAALAVASAVRHLSEREATFARTDVLKAALDFGLPTTAAPIERQVDRLLASKVLLKGRGSAAGMVTTLDALQMEQRIVGEVRAGRGSVEPVIAPDLAAERLQALSEANSGLTLNGGQEAAGRLILGSSNRIVAVQGIAGSGKSTLLRPLAELLREEGRKVVGLAVQNTLVQMLERDTGIASMTVARFLREHRALLGADPDARALGAARNEWRGSVILLDEASMVGNVDLDKLARLANRLEVQRFALVGDRRQLGAVDAGKPFDVLQKAGMQTAAMNLNTRARDETLRHAQYAAQSGETGRALALLKPYTIETHGDLARTAAEHWLSLPIDERAQTAIFVAGRRLRGEVNAAVQDGRHARGEIGAEGLPLETLVRVQVTREELRHADAYRPGQVLQLSRPLRAQGLKPGEHRVEGVDRRSGVVTLRDARGQQHRFRPVRLRPGEERSPLELYDKQKLDLHAGDPVRWTSSDHRRGLFNADRAEVLDIGRKGVLVRTSAGVEVLLGSRDPMLRRLDLAYALNAHMAQGLTSDRGIAVIDSSERKLVSEQNFLVTVTRLRDGITLIVDSGKRLQRAVELNPGTKTSALEATARLDKAAGIEPPGTVKGEPPKGQNEQAKAAKTKPQHTRKDRELQKSRSRSFDYGL